MDKLKEHEKCHEDFEQFTTWHYNFMDRLLKTKPLRIYFDCSICHSTLGVEFAENIEELSITNKSELKHDMKLVKEQGIENIFRVHPRGKIITMVDKQANK